MGNKKAGRQAGRRRIEIFLSIARRSGRTMRFDWRCHITPGRVSSGMMLSYKHNA